MKKLRYIFLVLYVFVIIYSWSASLQSGEASSGISSQITNYIVKFLNNFNKNIDESFDIIHLIVRKLIGHFGSFALMGCLGFLMYYGFGLNSKKILIISLSIGLFIAIVSELLQLIPQGRGCSIVDVLIDFSGYMISTIICYLITKLIQKKKKK